MAKEKEEKEDTEATGGGKKKLVIIIVPIVILLAGLGWFFFLKPDKSGAPEPLPHPTPGAVVTLDSITVNLAAGHFLKLGIALQPIAAAHELDGAPALDLAIAQFSQKTISELSSTEGRTKAKEELVARVKLTYLPHGTDLAAVISTEAPGAESDHEEEAKADHGEEESDHEEESAKKGDSEEHAEEIHIDTLSAAEVIKMADSLTVQAEVYDVYFTEFVMQ